MQDGTDSNGQPLTWYKTGDLVRVRDTDKKVVVDGQEYWDPTVTVMGRLASAVRLCGGAVVSPDVLEATYAVSPLLGQIFIHGQSDSRALVAVVVRTPAWSEALRIRQLSGRNAAAASDRGEEAPSIESVKLMLEPHSNDDLEAARELVAQELLTIARENGLCEADIPRAIFLDTMAWSVENGMLNASLKKQRAKFLPHYDSILKALHHTLL